MDQGDDRTDNAYGFEDDRVFSEPESSYTSSRLSNMEFARELRRRTKEAAIQLINFMQQAGKILP